MPGKKAGTINDRKTTSRQQRLMGIARGMQEGTVPKSYSKEAASIASSIAPEDLHNIAKKPKGGYRSKPKRGLMNE